MGENRGELGLYWEERGSRSGEGVAGEIRRVVGGFYGAEGESGGDHRGVMGGEEESGTDICGVEKESGGKLCGLCGGKG